MCKYISISLFMYAFLWIIASFFIGKIIIQYDEIFLDKYNYRNMKNVIIIDQNIDQYNMEIAINNLRIYKQNRESREINIFLRTNGGDVLSGYLFILEMELMKLDNIVFNCYAKRAASFGFNIFQYCDNRYVSKDGYLYIHDINIKVNLEGNIDKIEDYYINKFSKIKFIYNEINKYISRKLKLTQEEYTGRLKNEWLIVGGRNILSNKLADKMVYIYDF
jgi:ATP-dependent protease ClpP protease subunit